MTSSAHLSVAGLDVDVVYKDIKHLHIGVYPPFGRVRVAAPSRLDDEQVRLAVVGRLAWIKRERQQLRSAERESERAMLTGESHDVWGRRLRLRVVVRPGPAHVDADGRQLVLSVPEDADAVRRRAVLDRWYRAQLRSAIPELLATWEARLELDVPDWSIRRMRTRWGTCNPDTRHIRINVELAKKPPRCLEYVLVHEMCHYLERGHGPRFTRLMDTHVPDWRRRRDELNRAPLAHETCGPGTDASVGWARPLAGSRTVREPRRGEAGARVVDGHLQPRPL